MVLSFKLQVIGPSCWHVLILVNITFVSIIIIIISFEWPSCTQNTLADARTEHEILNRKVRAQLVLGPANHCMQ